MSQSNSNTFSPSVFSRKVLITCGIVIPIILFTLLFGSTIKVFILILAGAFIASFFRGIADWFQHKTSLNERWSLVVSIVLVILIIAGISWLISARVSSQMDEFSEKLPQAIENARDKLEETSWGSTITQNIPKEPEKIFEKIQGTQFFSGTFKVFSGTLGILADLYIVFFIGLFFLINPKTYIKGLISLIPKKGRSRAQEVIQNIDAALKKWILGKLLSMLIVAVLTGIGLAILGVPLPWALGLIAGILSFIPNFGPLLSYVVGFLFALLEGFDTALYTLFIYIGVQFIESNILTPMIQEKMVSIPPAGIIITQTLLAVLIGGWGLVLAVPIMVIFMILVKMLYVKDVLGDSAGEVSYE